MSEIIFIFFFSGKILTTHGGGHVLVLPDVLDCLKPVTTRVNVTMLGMERKLKPLTKMTLKSFELLNIYQLLMRKSTKPVMKTT